MSKKFTEYSQLNLSEINKEVLKKWDEKIPGLSLPTNFLRTFEQERTTHTP